MAGITLKSAEDLLPEAERIVSCLSAQLQSLAPDADVHHIGATAIAGALTKGDVDILLRVSAPRFQATVKVLSEHFAVKQASNWTAEFASFGDDVGYQLPVGIQVMVKDSNSDFLLYLRDYFRSRPAALREYNQLKVAHANAGAEDYWGAKDEFLAKILVSRNQGCRILSDQSTLPTPPGASAL